MHRKVYNANGNHTFTAQLTVLGSSTAIPQAGVPFDVTYFADLFLPSQNPAVEAPAVPSFATGSGQSWRIP